MRIAFYSPRQTHLEPALAHGGDPIFLQHLLAALARRGHDVRVISRLNVRDVWRGRTKRRRVVAEALRITRDMKRFRPHAWLAYDVSPTYPDLFGWWQQMPRYVLLSPHTWQSKRLSAWWRRGFAMAYRRSIARADAVLASGPASAERLRGYSVRQDRLRILPPAVPVPEAIPERAEARNAIGLDAAARSLLCVSRLTALGDTERKTEIVVDLVRALSALPPDVVLVVVGDGPGRPAVEDEVQRLAVGDRVRLVGARPFDELPSFFAASDLYAYPDQLDRARLAVLDAQAAGRPVVAMSTPSAALIVDDRRTGVLARDLTEFGEALTELLDDRSRRDSMGAAAREYVKESHSIEVRATQIEAFLGGQPIAAAEMQDGRERSATVEGSS